MIRSLLLCIIFMPAILHAQLETNHWFFNNDRASVKPSGVTVVNQGANQVTQIFGVDFASTSMADADGNLLFSTNGRTIYDRNQQIMPALLPEVPLFGSYSKVLIHPIPGTSRYFVFYCKVPDIENYKPHDAFQFNYAIVDMALNDGKGDVILYDQMVNSSVSPGFTIAAGTADNEAWLILHRHKTDSFYAYPLNAAGIGENPVISKAGTNTPQEDYNFRDLTASYDGSMIAGYSHINNRQVFNGTYRIIEVFSFNGTNGELKSKIRTPQLMANLESRLSVSFSPDSRLLYALTSTGAANMQPCGFSRNTLVQYDLCHTDISDFYHYSMTLVDNFYPCAPFATWGSLTMGADKKIHVPNSGKIVSQIHNPNKLGSKSGYQFNSYQLIEGNNQQPATPHFNPVIMKKAVQNNITYEGGCFLYPFIFKVSNPKALNFSWNFGDPTSGTANTSLLPSPSHVFSKPGMFVVQVSFFDPETNQNQNLEDTIYVINPDVKILEGYPEDTTFCSGETNLKLQLKANNAIYHWYQKDELNRKINRTTSDSLHIKTSGKWYVEMRVGGCTLCKIDSINVLFASNIQPFLADRILCNNQTISLGLQASPGAIYTWNTGASTSLIDVNLPGTYSLQVIYPGGCTYNASVNVTSASSVSLGMPIDTTLCTGEVLLLDPGVSYLPITWQDGSNTSSYLVEKSGIYWFNAKLDEDCEVRDSIKVQYAFDAALNLGNDTLMCNGNSLLIQTNIAGSYTWSTGATTPSISVSSSGNFWLKIKKDRCEVADTISVEFNSPPYFSLGADTVLCQGKELDLSPGINNAAYRWHDGSTKETFKVNRPGMFWVSITQNQCVFIDSIFVQYHNNPDFSLGANKNICEGDTTTFTAPAGFTAYMWNTGETTNSIDAWQQGEYKVEVTDENGCNATNSVFITNVFGVPNPNLGGNRPVCAGSNIVLNPGNFTRYMWQDGSIQSTFNATANGNYSVQVWDVNNCTSKDSMQITAQLPIPSNFLQQTDSLCRYEKLTLKTALPFRSYRWNTGQTQPQIEIDKPGIYSLTVIDENNCSGIDTIRIIQKNCMEGVYIPNAFTPNNDGLNEVFRPTIFGNVLRYELSVYNRYGERIFSTNEFAKGWDGTWKSVAMPANKYVWVCTYQLEGDEPKLEKGMVLLIR